MGKEREIKLRITDLVALRRLLRKRGARVVKRRVHERNALFDTLKATLAKRDELLRIRTEAPVGGRGADGSRSVLTFKRPISRLPGSGKEQAHKVREEIELGISDDRALTRIVEGLGMSCWFQYEKFRTTFRLPVSNGWATRLLIELDETPIGTFVELEGPASAIDRAARSLGFAKRDYIVANYMVLYRESCRGRNEAPRDMLFAKTFAKRKRRVGRKRAKKFS